MAIPEDAEDALQSPPPLRPRAPQRSRWQVWLTRLGWIAAGAVGAMVLGMETRSPKAEAPVATRSPVTDITVIQEKALSDTERLRVIVMPSELEYFGTRCLLYTNGTQAAIGCAGRDDLATEEKE